MKRFGFGLLILSVLALNAYAGTFLGTAGNFAVLGASTVTNVPTSTITGSVGVWSSGGANAITGFNSSPGVGVADPQVTGGLVYAGGPIPMAAQGDATTAYNTLAGEISTDNLTGMDLGGMILTPGVYTFSSTAQLTGALTLNFEGLSNQNIVFQIGSSLTTASASSVLIEGANSTDNVFWQVGSSATLGSTTSFAGNIIALTSVTLDMGATDLCGSVIARTGEVSMIMNTISNVCQFTGGGMIGGGIGGGPGVTAPEGGSTLLYLGFLLVPIGVMRAFRRRRRSV